MRSKLDHARGWLLKADSDLMTAKRILEGKGPYDTACFHAQRVSRKDRFTRTAPNTFALQPER
jgi:hypothetical protein